MQKRTMRVYPADRSDHEKRWLKRLLLFLSAAVIFSGLVWRGEEADVSIRAVATATPIPLDAAFDETMAEMEITLPQSEWYALQFGAFESEEAARQMAQQYIRRGAAGYVWQGDGRFRTLAAVYPQKDEAQMVREQLKTQHTVETYLFPIELPGIRLKLRGMQGQLDILQAAFVHANDLVVQLQALSIRMDRQEINVEESMQTLLALHEQMQTVALRLQQRFSPPRHEAVEGLLRCFESYSLFFTSLTGQDAATALGGKIKCQSLASLYELKQIYDALSHT